MSCERYSELIISRIGGEIAAEEEQDLQSHLESCGECRIVDLEFRAVCGTMRQLPRRDWDEKIRIKDLLRRDQTWRTFLLSKAALWIIILTAAITAVSFMPISWEVSANHFSLAWGGDREQETSDFSHELRQVQEQLIALQKQNEEYHRTSEMRIKHLVEQNNASQQKQYFQTMELFGNYLQMQRKADLQKIQHEIASTYDRTGQEVEKTNELLEDIIRVSATDANLYGNE